MKNEQMRAGPGESGGYTTSELQTEHNIDFGRSKSGAPNPKVATPERAVSTIEQVTGLKVANRNNPGNFAEAKVEGGYAIFVNKAHVIYAKISGGRVSILDPSVGKGWSSWESFLSYAKTNPSLYGPNPAASNRAYLFKQPQ
jgi:hypothetical protein